MTDEHDGYSEIEPRAFTRDVARSNLERCVQGALERLYRDRTASTMREALEQAADEARADGPGVAS